MLLLRAEMKLSGKAWLQFSVDQEGAKNRLSVNAYYQPCGVFGIPYRYVWLPFHFFIFSPPGDLQNFAKLRFKTLSLWQELGIVP